MIRALLVLGLAVFLAGAPAHGQAPAPRVALIVGNAAYTSAPGIATAGVSVLDASRDHGFGRDTKEAVPPGLAMMDAPAGMMIAFAAAPGAVSGEIEGPYSLYTGTLVTLMRQPGLEIEQIFKAARVQVNKVSTGAQTPWTASTLAVGLKLFDAPGDGTPAPAAPPPVAAAPPAPAPPPPSAAAP